MKRVARRWSWVGHRAAALVAGAVLVCVARAETCTTQSAMAPADRDALTAVARTMAQKVAANDAAGLRAATIAAYAKDFSAMENVIAGASAKVKGATLVVEQLYLLDATDLKQNPDGSAATAQFLCALNKSIAEADFSIPGLPAGKYAFAIVEARGIAAPWRLSFLFQQVGGQWQMAGFYPRPMTAAGNDGLWYWTQARAMAKSRQQWNAWLYYQQAEALLSPSSMIQSTHLEKLRSEQTDAAPPTISSGVSADTPLVVKGADGAEYHFTGLGVDDSLAKEKVDVTARLKVDEIGDPVAAKKRNTDAARALVAAYPELRQAFHGVWVFAEAQGQNPYATEMAMNEIH